MGATGGISQSASVRGSIKPSGVGGGTKKAETTSKKLSDPPTRLLKEVDINAIYDQLCNKCKAHCDGYVHLSCGRGGQHLNSDIEIDELIKQINTNDLLELLIVEKGSIAKIMIESINMQAPAEIMYKEEHVVELLKTLETDYYERYEFDDLMKMILEDRRLRNNFWISKITNKPIEKFKNPNLLNWNEKVDRKDIKNPYFSLQRILPISEHMKGSAKGNQDVGYDKVHYDHKAKYHQGDQDQIIQRTLGKEFSRVVTLDDVNNASVARNVLILKDYNDGRHGGWNNYCCYKGQNKGHFVDKKKTTQPTVEERKTEE